MNCVVSRRANPEDYGPCRQGHDVSERYFAPNGHINCRACRREQDAMRAERKRERRRKARVAEDPRLGIEELRLPCQLCCDDCGDVYRFFDHLLRHTLSAHGRLPTTRERTPRGDVDDRFTS